MVNNYNTKPTDSPVYGKCYDLRKKSREGFKKLHIYVVCCHLFSLHICRFL